MSLDQAEKNRHGLYVADDRKARFEGRSASSETAEINMPQNLSAEAAVIGAVMYSNRAFDRVSECLSEHDFYLLAHQMVWREISRLINLGQTADGVSLREHFERENQLVSVGGADYLSTLLDSAAYGPEVTDYARMVHATAQRRRVIVAAQESIEAAQQVGASPDALLNLARDSLAGVENYSLSASDSIENVSDVVGEMVSTMSDCLEGGASLPVGVSTGFAPLDKQLSRMHKGDLIVLAGRPAMGKTSLATNIAMNAKVRTANGSEGSARCIFFSLEMDREQMGGRVASQMARRYKLGTIPYRDLRGGSLGMNEVAILKAGLQYIPKTISMETEGQLTIDKICARAKAKRRELGGLDLVVIDYLQIIGDVIAETRNKTNAVALVTGRLKALAKELQCPIVVLSQLSRDVEKREDKRPLLSDLRDSGSIEQDADVVVFIYRHEYYLKAKEPEFGDVDRWGAWNIELQECKGRMDAIVSKNRHGPTSTVTLYCDLRTDCVVEHKEQLQEEHML